MTSSRAGLSIDRVETRRDTADFVNLPFRLYRRSSQWAPLGLVSDARRQLSHRHPFYRDSDACFFLARQAGETVGRIAAIDNQRYNRHQDRRTGFFGLFESVDDRGVADRLFDAAFEWLAGQRLEDIIGPRGILGHEGSLLVEGFEHPAVLGVPWNPTGYPAFVTGNGFVAMTDYLSGWFPGDHIPDPRIYSIADRARRRGGFSLQQFQTRAELRRWVPRILPVFLRTMSELGSFYPPTETEVNDTIDALLRICNPRGIVLVMKGEEVAGFLISYPDLAPHLRRTRGHLLPTGWATMLAARRRERAFVVNGLGLAPEYRGTGANAVLYAGLSQILQDVVGISRAEVVQVAATNTRSIEDMKTLGVRWYKRHRHYHRLL